MAIFRMEVKVISRNGGRGAVGSAAYRTGKCATAAVAYRHGVTMTDERTGLTFDYSKKGGILGAEIIAPASAPVWVQNREKLWNEVERCETRSNSRLAREIILTLPHELNHEQRQALVRGYVREQFVNDGMVADIAFHAPHRKGDVRNFHAHVMLTTRDIDASGFGKKRRDWNTIAKIQQWRETWANHINTALERAGFDERVDHRSLEDRGIDREPQTKLGPIASKMEREGRPSHAGDDIRAVAFRNAQRQALNAEHAAVTAQIIDLRLERLRRGIMEPANDEAITKRGEEVVAKLAEMKAADPTLSENALRFQEWKERVAREAEEAQQAEATRRGQEARGRAGDIADPSERYAAALRGFDAKDPYASLTAAAVKEAAIAREQQAAWRQKEAAEMAKPESERDQHKLSVYRMSREVEFYEYMAITSRRLVGISRATAGPGAEKRAEERGEVTQATQYATQQKTYEERATALRDEMAKRDQERDQHARDGMANKLGILAGSIDKGGAKTEGFDVRNLKASDILKSHENNTQQRAAERTAARAMGRGGGMSR